MERGGFRWLHICIGLICMVMIANLQYARTFFVPDIQKAFHWDRSEIQIAFTLFVLFESWLVPIEGWFVDQWGPKVVVLAGGILAGLGWIMNAYASRLGGLTGYYAAQIIAGVGAVYGTCLGNAPKWFPDKRGLAAGITAAGSGMGSAFTVVPIQNMIQGKPASGSELRRPTATCLRRLIDGSPQPIEGRGLSKMAQVSRRVYGR